MKKSVLILMKIPRQGYALFLFFLIALIALSSTVTTLTAQPLLPQKQKVAVQDFRKYVNGNPAQPNNPTTEKKRAPRRSYTDDDSGDTWYGIILDGEPYYYWQYACFYSGDPDIDNRDACLEYDPQADSKYPILTVGTVTIPDRSEYNGMYPRESGQLSVTASQMHTEWENFGDYGFLYFWDKDEFAGYARLQGWDQDYPNWYSKQLDKWWGLLAAITMPLRAIEPYQVASPYGVAYKAKVAKILSYENVFNVLDATQTLVEGEKTFNEDGNFYWYETNTGCLPTVQVLAKDGRSLNGERSSVANMDIETLVIPSQVKLLRWIPDNSKTDIYRTYTPELSRVVFNSENNLRQIGGFANHQHLLSCPIGTQTALKVIEDYTFANCKHLYIDSVDLRGKWVGTEAFNEVMIRHLDVDATTTGENHNAKLYGVMCQCIKMHHASTDTDPLPAERFLKQVNGRWVLDKGNESTVFVPCYLLDAYKTDSKWGDIADQIVGYDESTGNQNDSNCNPSNFYVFIDGRKVSEGVYYTQDDVNHTMKLVMIGDTQGRVLEVPHDFDEDNLGVDGYVVDRIGLLVGYGRQDFKRLILPATIKRISHRAFTATTIEYVSEHGQTTEANSFPTDIKSIGRLTFALSSLKGGIAFPYGINKIDDYAFEQTDITSLYLPGSLETPEDSIHWEGSGSNAYVKFRETPFAIGEWSFFGCPYLTSVYMDEGINGVAECAFQFDAELVHMHVPNTMKYIGGHFCCAAWKMQTLTIPSSVTDIDASFIHGCESMRNVYLLGDPAMLKTEHHRSGQSFGPVDPILEYFRVPDYRCKHVNNCTFNVNDLQTYYDYINYVNIWGEKPWLRVDRHDLAYNLYGSDHPEWVSDWWYMRHIDDFPVNVSVYNESSLSLQDSSAPFYSRRANGEAGAVNPAEGLTTSETAYLSTGYHNTYNVFNKPEEGVMPVFDHKWSTICFPKFIPSNLFELLGTGGIVAELTGARLDSENSVIGAGGEDQFRYHLTFTPITSVSEMKIDWPYLIRPGLTAEEEVDIPMYDEQHPMTVEDWTKNVIKTVPVVDEVDGTTSEISMVGTYIQYQLQKAEFYLKNYRERDTDPWSMKFYKNPAYGSSSVAPFKCYFKIEKNHIQISNAAMGSFFLDEDADGIGETRIADFDGEWPEGVYTLNGTRVTNTKNLKPGIYIMNGKKVVVK